jgi:hypothetical protein
MTYLLAGSLAALSLLVQARGPVPRGPYATLFRVPVQTAEAPRFQAVQPIPATVEKTVERGPCNMPVIVGNANVDPKMIVPVERGSIDHKIRVIEPAVCWEK